MMAAQMIPKYVAVVMEEGDTVVEWGESKVIVKAGGDEAGGGAGLRGDDGLSRAKVENEAAARITHFIRRAADKVQGRSTFTLVDLVQSAVVAAHAGAKKTRHVSTKAKSKMRASVFEEAETAMEGYLQKRSSGRAAKWQVRFFVFAGHYLKYYSDAGAAQLKGVLDVDELQACVLCNSKGTEFILTFFGGAKASVSELVLRAPGEGVAKEWMQALLPFIVPKAQALAVAEQKLQANATVADDVFQVSGEDAIVGGGKNDVGSGGGGGAEPGLEMKRLPKMADSKRAFRRSMYEAAGERYGGGVVAAASTAAGEEEEAAAAAAAAPPMEGYMERCAFCADTSAPAERGDTRFAVLGGHYLSFYPHSNANRREELREALDLASVRSATVLNPPVAPGSSDSAAAAGAPSGSARPSFSKPPQSHVPALLLSFEEPGEYLCLRVPNAALCEQWLGALRLAMDGNAAAVRRRLEACAALREELLTFLRGQREALLERGGGGGGGGDGDGGGASAAPVDAKALAAFDKEAGALATDERVAFWHGEPRALSSLLKARFGVDHLGDAALWAPVTVAEDLTVQEAEAEEARREDVAARRVVGFVRFVVAARQGGSRAAALLGGGGGGGGAQAKGKGKGKARRRASVVKDKKAYRASVYTNGAGDPPPVQQGYLEKQSSGLLKKWQARYFSLSTHYLKYFADSKMEAIKAVVDMSKLEVLEHALASREFRLVVDGVLLQLKAPSATEATVWVAALRPFAARTAATRRAGGQQRVLAQMKAKGPLRLQDVQVMMHSLNAKIAPKKLRAAFVEADADKSGKLEWGEFCALFRTLQSRPACLPALFAAACPAGKTELAAADLQKWRKEQQLDEAVSLADCEAIIDGFNTWTRGCRERWPSPCGRRTTWTCRQKSTSCGSTASEDSGVRRGRIEDPGRRGAAN
jgi:hypothetical protein